LIIPDHTSGFPVLRALSLCTCCRHYPGAADGRSPRSKFTHPCQPSPIPLSGRPAHRPFRGLLGVYSRCGLHTRAVTKFVTAIRGLQTFRHLHACPGCFRLERSPGGACTRWKSAALSRRTWEPVCSRRLSDHEPRVLCREPYYAEGFGHSGELQIARQTASAKPSMLYCTSRLCSEPRASVNAGCRQRREDKGSRRFLQTVVPKSTSRSFARHSRPRRTANFGNAK
jgi:hypothetical protein